MAWRPERQRRPRFGPPAGDPRLRRLRYPLEGDILKGTGSVGIQAARLRAGTCFATTAEPIALAAGGIALVSVLGVLRRSPDRPVTSWVIDSDVLPKLTADLILTALDSLGIGELNKAITRGGDSAVRFPAPIVRDGPGFRADPDLLPDVTPGDVIERRDRLASGLRRPLSSVWPSADHDTHAGRLILWVGDKPMSKARPVPWPLQKTGKVDLSAPIVIGADPQGRPVTVTLMFALMIIGALPRMGKTSLLRLLTLAAALDPSAELHVYDLKGGADFLAVEPIAHRFRVGDDPDDLACLKTDLRAIHADMSRRYKQLRSLPRDVCPEGKGWSSTAMVSRYAHVVAPIHGDVASRPDGLLWRGGAADESF